VETFRFVIHVSCLSAKVAEMFCFVTYATQHHRVKNVEISQIVVRARRTAAETAVRFAHHAGYQRVKIVEIFPIAILAILLIVENVVFVSNACETSYS